MHTRRGTARALPCSRRRWRRHRYTLRAGGRLHARGRARGSVMGGGACARVESQKWPPLWATMFAE
eukprot:5694362-Pleurochrysis_carterae.AAC.2